MKKGNQNWTILACELFLVFLAIEYITFCVIVPQKLVMDIALIISLAIFTVTFLLIESHDKKEKMCKKNADFSFSTPLFVVLVVVGMLLVWLEHKYLNLKNAPYFTERMMQLYLMIIITTQQFDARWRAIKSAAESN